MKSKKKTVLLSIAAMVAAIVLGMGLYNYPNMVPFHSSYDFLNGFSYTVYSDHVELHEYKWDYKTVRIPDYLWGRPVTVIGECCFQEKGIRTVVLPKHLQTIERDAFENCSELEQVLGGKAARSIGSFAFCYCTALRKLELGENVQEIEWGAFRECSSLETFAFGESVQTIDDNAFFWAGLQELPDDLYVECIGDDVFEHTPWMDRQTGEFIIYGDILLKYNGNSEVVRVPEGVRGITGRQSYLDDAKGNEKLAEVREIYLPDSVEYITAKAFNGSENLRVYIPASVTQISRISSFDGEVIPIGDETMTIVTTAGSAAEAHAKETGIPCEIVEGW